MTPSDIEKIFRDEAGRALATLIRLVGDFDLAQDSLQDAFAVALERWPAADPPSNPRAWLVNVGRNKAIDRVRRQVTFRDKQSELTHELLNNAAASDEGFEPSVLDDDMLRLPERPSGRLTPSGMRVQGQPVKAITAAGSAKINYSEDVV